VGRHQSLMIWGMGGSPRELGRYRRADLSTFPAQRLSSRRWPWRLAKPANDAVVAAVTQHPDRFPRIRHCRCANPSAAAGRVERTVRDHGFVGAMINCARPRPLPLTTVLWPVFQSAETLACRSICIPPFGAAGDRRLLSRLCAAGVRPSFHRRMGLHIRHRGPLHPTHPRRALRPLSRLGRSSWPPVRGAELVAWRTDLLVPGGGSGLSGP